MIGFIWRKIPQQGIRIGFIQQHKGQDDSRIGFIWHAEGQNGSRIGFMQQNTAKCKENQRKSCQKEAARSQARRMARWPHASLRGSRYGFGFCISALCFQHCLSPQGAGRIEPAERYTASPRSGVSELKQQKGSSIRFIASQDKSRIGFV